MTGKYKYMIYKEFLKSEKWNVIRKEAYKIFGHKCWFCGCGGVLNLHHTKYFKTTLGKSKKLPKNNLRWFLVLCEDCHYSIHNLQKVNKLTVYEATKLFRDKLYPKKRMWMTKKEIKKICRQNKILKDN